MTAETKVVAGLGPVGGVLAALLGSRAVEVVVVETNGRTRSPGPPSWTSRPSGCCR